MNRIDRGAGPSAAYNLDDAAASSVDALKLVDEKFGFPAGSLLTPKGFVIAPSESGPGFKIYGPGASPTSQPAFYTQDNSLYDANKAKNPQFEKAGAVQLPDGTVIVLKDPKRSDKLNQDIAIIAGKTMIAWALRPGVAASIAADNAELLQMQNKLEADKKQLAADTDSSNKAGQATGITAAATAASIALAPFTFGLSLIGLAPAGAAAAASGISTTVFAGKVNADQKAVDADQKAIDDGKKKLQQDSRPYDFQTKAVEAKIQQAADKKAEASPTKADTDKTPKTS